MKQLLIAIWVIIGAGVGFGGETPGAPVGAQAPATLADSQAVTEGIIAAPPAELWRVFSTAEGFKALGVVQAAIDFRPGGLILSSYDANAKLGDENTIQTEIIAYDPGRLLVTRIHLPPKGFPFPEAYKRVWTVIALTDLGDGRTHLRIAMNGYGADEESQKMRQFFTTGNEWVLKQLQSKYVRAAAPTGPAHAESPLAALDLARLIPAPRADVWQAMSTAAGWKALFGAESKIGAVPGESFEPFPGTEGGKLLTVVPAEILSFTWSAPAKYEFAQAHPTWVAVNFEAVSPKVTRVRLRQFGFAELAANHPDQAAELAQAREYFAGAWPKVLGRLAAHFGAAE